ncbi:MAG: TetR/AcrR family transcriptional regulator [Terriglobales bacterium]
MIWSYPMVRIADQRRPEELLDAIVGYIAKKGVAGLSLRPLAKAVHSSPRVLLYYFGSKEKLVSKAIARLRVRQRAGFGKMREASYDRPSDACRAIWMQMSAPESESAFKLSFEVYALALRHPRRLADFLHSSVEDWLEFLSEPLLRQGRSKEEARAFATIVVAGFRGFMLDYCASHDRERVDRAVELWLKALDSIRLPMPFGAENCHVH